MSSQSKIIFGQIFTLIWFISFRLSLKLRNLWPNKVLITSAFSIEHDRGNKKMDWAGPYSSFPLNYLFRKCSLWNMKIMEPTQKVVWPMAFFNLQTLVLHKKLCRILPAVKLCFQDQRTFSEVTWKWKHTVIFREVANMSKGLLIGWEWDILTFSQVHLLLWEKVNLRECPTLTNQSSCFFSRMVSRLVGWPEMAMYGGPSHDLKIWVLTEAFLKAFRHLQTPSKPHPYTFQGPSRLLSDSLHTTSDNFHTFRALLANFE